MSLSGFLVKYGWLGKLLYRHKALCFASLFFTLLNTVIFALGLSFVLPVVNVVLFEGSNASIHQGGGLFAWVQSFLDSIIPPGTMDNVLAMAVLTISQAANAIFTFVVQVVNSFLTERLTVDCRRSLHRHIQSLIYNAFSKEARGTYVQLLVTEVRSIYMIFKQSQQLFQGVLNILVAVLVLFMLSAPLTLILISCFAFLGGIGFVFSKKMSAISKIGLSKRLQLNQSMTESIFGIKQVKLLCAEDAVSQNISRSSARSEQQTRRIQVLIAAQPMINQIFMAVVFMIIIFVAFQYPVFAEGMPTKASIITFLLVLARISVPLVGIAGTGGNIISNLPGLRKISEFYQEDMHREASGNHVPDAFMRQSLVLDGVTFGYIQDAPPILRGLDLQISKGDYIGILGPSGQGKSTMFNTITRVIDPQQGRILLDGMDTKEIDLTWLRHHIGLLPQDFFLFNTTIGGNLRLAQPDASDEALMEALDKAGLGEYIRSHHQGLDVPVGANGEQLSGGQRQRLGLAVLFLRDPDIIILDEGLSAVDPETEAHILASLRALNAQGKTIISSSHQASALQDAQRLYTLRHGTLESVEHP